EQLAPGGDGHGCLLSVVSSAGSTPSPTRPREAWPARFGTSGRVPGRVYLLRSRAAVASLAGGQRRPAGRRRERAAEAVRDRLGGVHTRTPSRIESHR